MTQAEIQRLCRAVSEQRGEYECFEDPVDYLEPGNAMRLLESMLRHPEFSVTIGCGEIEVLDERKETPSSRPQSFIRHYEDECTKDTFREAVLMSYARMHGLEGK